jgi:hypothetical protein
VRFLVGRRDLSRLHKFQADPRVHPASYPMSTEGSFPGAKRSERETDHSALTRFEVESDRAIITFLHTSLWRGPLSLLFASCLLRIQFSWIIFHSSSHLSLCPFTFLLSFTLFFKENFSHHSSVRVICLTHSTFILLISATTSKAL